MFALILVSLGFLYLPVFVLMCVQVFREDVPEPTLAVIALSLGLFYVPMFILMRTHGRLSPIFATTPMDGKSTFSVAAKRPDVPASNRMGVAASFRRQRTAWYALEHSRK